MHKFMAEQLFHLKRKVKWMEYILKDLAFG